jgi:hypothetical protein
MYRTKMVVNTVVKSVVFSRIVREDGGYTPPHGATRMRGSMADTRIRSAQAHKRSVTFEIDDIAEFLQENLGQKLVAYMAEVSDAKTVGKWASGAQKPRPDADSRLRAAFQIFHLLQSEESPHTVRAWFIGMNPQLDDESPAQAIREGRMRDALVAAKAYVAGG